MGKSKQSVSDRVYNDIIDGIASRQFLPGEHLVEADLMEGFSCSRTTIREVFRRLVQEGVVEHIQNKGVRIKRLSQKELMDIKGVLKALMAEAVGVVAQNHTPQDIKKLNECIAKFEESIETSQNLEAGKWYNEFQFRMAEISQNTYLYKLVRQYFTIIIFNSIGVNLAWEPVHYDRSRKSLECYKEIVTAIKASDVVQGMQLVNLLFEEW